MRFTDSAGAQWSIRITVGTLQKIKRELDIDLLDRLDQWPQQLGQMVGCLWCCLEDDLEAAGITPEGFAERLDGEVLPDGMDAFVEALAFFFKALQPAKSQLLKDVWAKGKEMEAKILAKGLARLGQQSGD